METEEKIPPPPTAVSGDKYVCLFDDLSRRLQTRFSRELESIVLFSAPFSNLQRGALVVLADATPSLLPALACAGARIIQEVHVITLRTSELYQLSLPHPMVAWTLSTPYWIREEGQVLRGRDVRREVPYYRRKERLLANHLAAVAHRLRNHVILGCLTAMEYCDLEKALRKERALLMCTALLLHDVWRVYPDSVTQQFVELYADSELLENITEVSTLQAEMQSAGAVQQKRLAYRSVWLFESFLRRLWTYAS